MLVLAGRSCHLRLQALLVDLASYNAQFVQADPELALWAEALEGASRGMKEDGEEEVTLPTFTHTTQTITYPAASKPVP